MTKLRTPSMAMAFVIFFSFLAVIGNSTPVHSEVSLEEFQRMDHISQRNYLYSSLDQPGFTQSPKLMQNAVHFLNRLDWSRLPVKDGILVDKFLQKIPMDIPASRTVANRYFSRISSKKLSVTSGNGLSWNGKVLTSQGGAVVDPRKIPMDVLRVEEVNGNFVFYYKPDEPDTDSTRVTLRKGEFELGGMHDELTQPSQFAQFSVEGGDAEIGGIIFHPDSGRIDALGDDNYKILDTDLEDGDPASVIMLGKNRRVRADVEVLAKQSVTFVGGIRSVFNQYRNGVLVEGSDLYAKGSFDLALSEFSKDKAFAKYTFKNGVLDMKARKVTSEETNSEISIHHIRKGERVVWDVDGDDFEEAPVGYQVTPKPGKAGVGEVRGENTKSPKKAPALPERRRVVMGLEKGRIEGEGKKSEKAPGEPYQAGRKNAPNEKSGISQLVKPEVILPTGIVFSHKLGPELKAAIENTPISRQDHKDIPKRVKIYFFSVDVTPEGIHEEFLKTVKSNSEKLQRKRPDLRQLEIDFRHNHMNSAADFFSQNLDIGKKNTIKTRIVGDSVVIQIQDKPTYFVFPKKFREVADLLTK